MATVAKKKRTGRADVELEEQAAVATKKRRGTADERQEEATEEEVEEFFAILRRIRESAAGFAPGRGVGRRRLPGSVDEPEGRRVVPAWRWRPSFEWEDFGEASAGREGEKKATPPAAECVEEEEEDDGEDDDHEVDVSESAAEVGLRRRFDLNLEPPASDEQPAAALSCRYERKLD